MSVGVTAEVKSKLSVVDVVGETVTLKKAGTTYKGLCPFHGEKTPSFVVTPMRESWHCFGCGLGGDIFSFVMQRDGATFPEALRTLASKAGVEIDERTKREDARRARLRQVLDTAIAFYHAVLTGSKAGQPALEYLHGRGFTDATIEAHQLGWAPNGWDQMARQLQAKRDIRGEELVEVGLASPSQRGHGVIDKFRARVLFPIRDANGHAVGLGGRLLEGEGPKYLNSPATPLFDKSRTLYLIDKAKGPIRRSGQAVIVEGYTDALMAHQAGFDNVVASLGTALTPGQVALLTRYATRIALAYDVDAAGEKAGTLGVTALAGLIGQLQDDASGVKLEDVRVVKLPDGQDPDEVVRGAPADWETAVSKAKPLVEYLIDHHAGRYDLKTSTGRIGFVESVMPAIRDIADPLRRDEALQEVRRVSGVEERVLRQVLDRRIAAAVGPGRGNEAATRISAEAVLASPDALPVGDILRAVTPVEAELLRLLLLVPDQQLRVGEELGPDQLPSTLARELFRAMVLMREADDHGVHPPFDGAALLLSLDDETAALARALYAKPGPDPRTLTPGHLAYEVTRLLLELEDDSLRERSDYNEAAQAEAERAGDTDAIERLMLERRQINESRRSIDRRREDTRLFARPTVAGRR
ncbi:MAG TPA: DNA primase [Candidatus Saccharimonadales bacterium]|nr:DNA primase [Candidatus Saccharimonadales bacterium]